MRQKLLLLSVLSFSSLLCFSQQMDTFLLKDFEVKIPAITTGNIGITKLNLNTSRYNTLADALQIQSALFVKQYSPGGLATAGMRGMGAQHTAVLWNGVYINSCMNSNLDLNLIPLFFIDNASLETGANAAACGNGAIAGAIHLSNDIEKGNQIFSDFQYGSFGYYQAGIGASYHLNSARLKTRLLYRTAENDIAYHDIFQAGAPLKKQTNSAYVQKGILQEFDLALGRFNTISSALWLLENKRGLPPAMGAGNGASEKQYDLNMRLVLNHRYKKSDKLIVNNKAAVLYDQLNYYNAYYPAAYNVSKSLIAETEWHYKINRFNRLTNALSNNYSTAKADGYLNWPSRNMLSWWLKYDWQNKNEKLILSIGSRILYVKNKLAPFSPDFAFQYMPARFIKIKGNAACSYRVPSFNDYYWQQGGNTNLLPERGFKQELSAEIKKDGFKFTTTVFHHIVNNWIMWVASGSGTYWMAQNAKQVTSNGLEISADYTTGFGDHSIQITGRYQYVESVNTAVYQDNEAGLNRQLTYTPFHTATSNINYKWKKLFCNLNSQFIGSRYTTTDNSPDYRLPAYLLVNSTAGYEVRYKRHLAFISFAVNNIFNRQYQIMENRPTPLRNYQITLKYNITND